MREEKYLSISNKQLTSMLNKSIALLMENALKIALMDFTAIKSLTKIILKQRNRGNIRAGYEKEEGVHIPPFMIASVTKTCNLRCKGCYDREKPCSDKNELDEIQWKYIFQQAGELGVSFILLAGGEPLIKDKIIKECINYPEIIFPMFTNGLLINEEWVNYFNMCRNLIPIISIEGDKFQTDLRRGIGVFSKISSNIELLRNKNILYGISITLTSENFSTALNKEFIKGYIDRGCKLFFFIEYVPFDTSTEHLVIDEDLKVDVEDKIQELKESFKEIFISFPGDEKQFGGCLAAGRGFVHINATGGVEACPFAPYSDENLTDVSLKEAFNSKCLEKIRDIHGLLQNKKSGCILFDNKEIVEETLKNI